MNMHADVFDVFFVFKNARSFKQWNTTKQRTPCRDTSNVLPLRRRRAINFSTSSGHRRARLGQSEQWKGYNPAGWRQVGGSPIDRSIEHVIHSAADWRTIHFLTCRQTFPYELWLMSHVGDGYYVNIRHTPQRKTALLRKLLLPKQNALQTS